MIKQSKCNLIFTFFQPELNSNIILTEKKEPKARKLREISPDSPVESWKLKSHKFEKLPAEEHVRVYEFRLFKYPYIYPSNFNATKICLTFLSFSPN